MECFDIFFFFLRERIGILTNEYPEIGNTNSLYKQLRSNQGPKIG